jgi:hypothetical protein
MKTTVIKHERSAKGAPLSLALISNLALDLSRLEDGTIDRATFRENFQTAFEILTEYDRKLSSQQEILPTM